MLKIDNLSFRYPHQRKAVIKDLTMSLDEGGIYGLLGPNGAGKSTLLYLISGLLTPLSGKVDFNGTDTRRRHPATLADIFIVPEELTLPSVTIDTYIRMNAPFYHRFSMDDMNRHMATFDIDSLRGQKISTLSMGQKKKLFMCFALACNTSLLLMDEPTNGLDIPGKAAFRRFIASSASEDKTIVISTHQVRDIDRILDHVVIMNENDVILNCTINEISSKLAFLNTADREVIDGALFSQPAVGGAQVIVANDGSYDTEVNLESLFEFVTTRRDSVNYIFKDNKNTAK